MCGKHCITTAEYCELIFVQKVCGCLCLTLGLRIWQCDFVCRCVNVYVFQSVLRSPPSKQLHIISTGSPGRRVSNVERQELWRTREKGDGNWKEGVKGSAMMGHMIYLSHACLATRLRCWCCIGAFVEGQGTEIASSVSVLFFYCCKGWEKEIHTAHKVLTQTRTVG